MKITVSVEKDELRDLDVTVDQLKESIASKLNGGIDIDNGQLGTLHLSSLQVEVEVT